MKLRYKILFIAVALVGLSSCKDFLETVPDTRVYLVNLDQLQQLLITGYMESNYALVGELSSDNVIDNNSPSDKGVRYHLSSYDLSDEQVYAWEDVDLDISDNDTPSGLWNACYGAIAVANAVLDKALEFKATGMVDGQPMSASDKARLDAILGEAYMIRAYHHFILAQLFCMPYRGDAINATLPGIPYSTTIETTLDPKYDRGTLKQTYDSIEADLLRGLPLINEEYYQAPKYHFNIASSNSFAARFYLIKREYDKVVEYATAAFRGNEPTSMFNDGWWQEDFYYISDIGRYFTSVDRPGNFMLFTSYSTWWRRFLGYRFTCNRDAKRATIQGPGPSWKRCQYQNTRTKDKFAMMPCFNGTCGSAGGQEYGAYFAGTCFEQFEYTDKIAGIGYCHEIRPEFSSEETLLMRAEANLFLGNIDAAFDDLYLWNEEHLSPNENDRYNHISLTKQDVIDFYGCYDDPDRADPGFGIVMKFHIDEVCPSDKYRLTDEIEPYLQCVQHFRRIQLVHMGNRWFDIKRFGFTIQHKMGISDVYTLEVLDPRYAIQIPSEVIGAGLDPNPRSTNAPVQAPRIGTDENVRISD